MSQSGNNAGAAVLWSVKEGLSYREYYIHLISADTLCHNCLMSLFEGVTAFIHELNNLGIQYGVIGGIAVFAYGGERTTFDVDFLIDGKHRDELKNLANQMKLNIVNENAEVLQFSGAVQINIVFTYRPASMGSQKTNLSFQQYCAKIEELLKLTGRKIKPRAKIEPTAFIL